MHDQIGEQIAGEDAACNAQNGNDLSGMITQTTEGQLMTLPKNTTGQDQTYRITATSMENENIAVTVLVTVKSEAVEGGTSETPDATEPADPPVIPVLPLPQE